MAISSEGKVTKPFKKLKPNISDAHRAAIEKELDKEDGSEISAQETVGGSKPKEPAVIDGKTYACQACKTGHRVATCTHFKTKPLTPTNPPGRPASGIEKRKKCKCTCTCSTKGCKCGKNCHCTLQMWVVVQIPDTDQYKLDREVTTDLKGLPLDDEEIERRRKMAEAVPKPASKLGTASVDRSRADSSTISSPSQARPVASGGCCKHKEKAEKQKEAAALVDQKSSKQCNCGIDCTCGFCPEHPNNAFTTNFLKQQVQNLNPSGTDYLQAPLPFESDMSLDMSCMGGLPQLTQYQFWGVPSLDEFTQFLPAHGGYTMAYPVNKSIYSAHDFDILHTSEASHQNGSIGAYPTTDMTSQQFDIGEAVVLSSNVNGQHQFLSSNTLPLTAPYHQQQLLSSLTTATQGQSPSSFDLQPPPNQSQQMYFSYPSSQLSEQPVNQLPTNVVSHSQPNFIMPTLVSQSHSPHFSASLPDISLSPPAEHGQQPHEAQFAKQDARSSSAQVRSSQVHGMPTSPKYHQAQLQSPSTHGLHQSKQFQNHWASPQQLTCSSISYSESGPPPHFDIARPASVLQPGYYHIESAGHSAPKIPP